jgi:hypothetical protein
MKPLPSFALILTLALLGVCALARAQSSQQQLPGNAADPMQAAAKIVNTSGAWMNGSLSTPGTSAEARDVGRSGNPGGSVVKYHVWVHGAPKDQTYRLISWPINAAESSEQMEGLTISDNGLVVCAGRTAFQCGSEQKKDDPVEFTFSRAQGEVYRLALLSADGNTKIFFAIVPDPIINKSHGCSLEAVRLMPHFELVLVRAKGFQPNEDLAFSSKSYDEAHDQQVKADANGGYVSALAPFVGVKKSGKTSVRLKGAECSPEVSFEWGK